MLVCNEEETKKTFEHDLDEDEDPSKESIDKEDPDGLMACDFSPKMTTSWRGAVCTEK